jgi:outer membrane biosynthesis protein TonB
MTDKTKEHKEETKEQKRPEQSEKSDRPKEQEKEKQEQPAQEEKSKPEKSGPPLLDEPIKVIDYIYLNILTLENKAWAYMDLITHLETQKHLKDMEQAKLAIDTIDILYKTIEGHLTMEQKKDLQTRLTNLRLNFVKR